MSRTQPLLSPTRRAIGVLSERTAGGRVDQRLLLGLGAITLVAAIVRFSTLGVQSLWYDESQTWVLMPRGFLNMVAAVRAHETTPPLYYAVEWFWAHAAGLREIGLRSLSAIFGTATVPVMYWAGTAAATRRVGLFAAILTAVNPFLFWYSQEARSYALLVFLSALSLALFFEIRRRPSAARYLLWALASAAAVATHYFAGFLIIFEAIWLVFAAERKWRPTALFAVAALTTTGLGLLPIAVHQQHSNPIGWIANTRPLIYRLRQVPWNFMVGTHSTFEYVLGVVVAITVVVALWSLLKRAAGDERRLALVSAVLAAAALLLATALALAGHDYIQSRNLLEIWVPAALVVAAGLGARRLGVAGVVGLCVVCVLSLGAILSIDTNPVYQRQDWRGVAQAMGPATTGRAVVVTGYFDQPLHHYLPKVKSLGSQAKTGSVSQIVVVGMHRKGWPCWWGSACDLPYEPPSQRVPPGFHAVRLQQVGQFTLVFYQAPSPVDVDADGLRPIPNGGSVLLQAPA